MQRKSCTNVKIGRIILSQVIILSSDSHQTHDIVHRDALSKILGAGEASLSASWVLWPGFTLGWSRPVSLRPWRQCWA